MKNLYLSFEGRVALVSLSCIMVFSGIAAWSSQHMTPWWLAWILAVIPAIATSLFFLHRVIAPTNRLIAALRDGVASFSDADFSVSVAVDRNDELGKLAHAQNNLGDILRRERQSLYQRELLLDTVIQSAPTAMMLSDQGGHVVYSNPAARHLLGQGKGINGELLSVLADRLPSILQQAVMDESNGLFTVDASEQLTYHVSVNRFTLNTHIHKLYLIKHLSHEINRQEVGVWKKVIRLISHELNNSLAPISSLAHSGQLIGKSDDKEKIQEIFLIIKERAEHLKKFIEGYASFARLPLPRPEPVQIDQFIISLQSLQKFSVVGALPNQVTNLDPGQLQQALINLLKNAHESGSGAGEITLAAEVNKNTLVLHISDRGKGMPEPILKNALLPFYSTKTSGTGLGLPLCREIVEAHNGSMKLKNREGGGLEVTLLLPIRRQDTKV